MRKRSRIRLVVLLVVLGVPAVLALTTVVFVGTGGVERRLEAEYAAHFPGRLRIGSLAVAGKGRAIARDIRLLPPGGGEPLIRIAEADLIGGLMPPRLTALDLRGVTVRFDRDGIEFVRQLIAVPRTAVDPQPLPPVAVHIAGSIAIAQRLQLSEVELALTIDHWAATGTLAASLGGTPLRLSLAAEPGTDDRRPTSIAVEAAMLDLGDLFAAVSGLGLMPQQEQVLEWLPRQADLSGTRLRADPAAAKLDGSVTARWDGGAASAQLDLDAGGVRLDGLQMRDAQLGSAEGRLAVAFGERDLHLEFDQWQPGPRSRIPPEAPMAALLSLMPAAELSLEADGPRIVLRLARSVGASEGPRVEARWRAGQALTVEAVELPASLAQPYAGDLGIAAGTVSRLTLTWEGHLQEAHLALADTTLLWRDWRFINLALGLDIQALDPHDVAVGYAVRADLPFGAVAWRGRIPGGRLELTIASVERLVASVQGPLALPPCTGLLKIIAELDRDGDAIVGKVHHLGIANLGAEGLLQDGSFAGRGEFRWQRDEVVAQLDGQLFTALAGLPGGRSIDLANRRPLLTATVAVDHRGVEVRELLARASGDDGAPAPDGFTGGIDGRIERDLSASLHGVVDRVNLDWLTSAVVALPVGSGLGGEGAITWNLTAKRGQVERVDGHVLPLGIDVRLLAGAVDISGITGAIHFLLTPAGTTP